MIDFYASEPHYLDHLAPIWAALPEERRGIFYVRGSGPRPAARRAVEIRGFEFQLREFPPQDGRPICVTAVSDVAVSSRRPVALLEHGAGQVYEEPCYGYAGGPNRERIGLFLCPSERVAALNQAAYPGAFVVAVGVPKMDEWHRKVPAAAWGRPRRPVSEFGRPAHVAFSWHWDCGISEFSGWAWPHYRPHLPSIWRDLIGAGYRVMGHAHPRAMGTIEQTYRRNGIDVVRSFEDVLNLADVYVCDNSSTLFEFASTNRPVVLLNQPKWSKAVELGLRFWRNSDIGLQVDDPRDVVERITVALADHPHVASNRARHVREVYAYTDGCASRRAANALLEWEPAAKIQGRQPQPDHLRGRPRRG